MISILSKKIQNNYILENFAWQNLFWNLRRCALSNGINFDKGLPYIIKSYICLAFQYVFAGHSDLKKPYALGPLTSNTR